MSSEDFRSTLLEIDGDLGQIDVERLKYLSKDHLPHSGLSTSTRGIDLFQILEQRGKLKDNNSFFLQECFLFMERRDLIRKLGGNPDDLERRVKVQGQGQILPFRALLYEISENVDTRDLETLKFFAKNTYDLSKKQVDSIETCADLFTVLEREETLTGSNVQELENLLKAIVDDESLELLEKYKQGLYLVDQTQNYNDNNMEVQPQNNVIHHAGQPNVRNTLVPSGGMQGRQPGQVNQGVIYKTLQSVQEQDASDTIMSVMNEQIDQGAGGVTYCTEQNNAMEDEFEEYEMTHKPRGYCIIINNREFTNEDISNPDEHLKNRMGSDIDEENLFRLFNRKLHFIVEVYKDVSCKEILDRCSEISKRDHSEFDALVFCIMSHGTLGKIYGVRGMSLEIRGITSYFTTTSCPTLAGKPKLFFLQACQGSQRQKGVPHSTFPVPPSTVEQDKTDYVPPSDEKLIPEESDFLLGYATVPGYASFRSRSRGSFYITKLVEMMEKHSQRYSLMDILIKVNQEVSEMDAPMEAETFKQIPAPQFTLRKRIFFRNLP